MSTDNNTSTTGIDPKKKAIGMDYFRFFYLIDFLIVQSEDISLNEKVAKGNRAKMADYNKRLNWIKRDLGTSASIEPETWDAIKTGLDLDDIKDLFVELDTLIDNKMISEQMKMAG